MKKNHLITFSILIIFSIFSFYIGYISNSSPQPMFDLNDSTAQYEITKKTNNDSYTYFIQKINNNTQNQTSDFKGDAIKINGACQNLDEFLDQPVNVEGVFSTQTGEHTYFITNVKRN